MKERIIAAEIALTDSVTDTNVAAIMQEVATLIYTEVTQ
jgi:hypothetical protein